MAHWTSAAAQVRALAKAVSAAFAASNLTPEEKSPGNIEIKDLPWQAPPLIVPAKLTGVPLQDYLDVPIALDANNLHTFWVDTLNQMWNTPGHLMRRGVLAACGVYMPKVKVGQRALRFPLPGGFPGSLEESAGAMFSLEVAHAALISSSITRHVSDDNNYFVELRGQRIGIINGRPACASQWNYDCSGLVPDMLAMPRGDTTYDCQYDQIASLRSVLHMHRKSFPRNFDALDLALQSLRLLTFGTYCPQLTQEMRAAPVDLTKARADEYALRDAVELLADPMSDRHKLQAMHSLLVPSVISVSSFRQHIYSGDQYPFTLAVGRLGEIEDWLRQTYNARVPLSLRQLKEKI